jgi:hypothetical protein
VSACGAGDALNGTAGEVQATAEQAVRHPAVPLAAGAALTVLLAGLALAAAGIIGLAALAALSIRWLAPLAQPVAAAPADTGSQPAVQSPHAGMCALPRD